MRTADALVLGAGPSGLGAALALARAGADVAVLEASGEPGGLCVTRRRDGFAYDLGGHIPFVRDAERRRWLEELLDGDVVWVDRPVACVRDGRIVPGRYLDQRPEGPVVAGAHDGSARGEVAAGVGLEFTDRVVRPYLEKIDGVPLERIPAERARKLRDDQAAPDGFPYPAGGIGALMRAMAAAVEEAGGRVMLGTPVTRLVAPGGRVRGVAADGPEGPLRIATPSVVVGVPAGVAARLLDPAPPPLPPVPMRAVCLVYLALPRPRLTEEAWIQVDDPRVPFARAAEPGNWSARLTPPGRTVVGLECYCSADPGDPVWGLSDDALARACAAALHDPLGWLDAPGEARLVEVVRLPRAYPVPDVRRMADALAPARLLEGVEGVLLAPGAAVIEAVEAGERAAARVLGARATLASS